MTKRLTWIDIGMAVALGGFIVLLFLQGEDFFVPAMLVYIVALVAWAAFAEVAATRAEAARTDRRSTSRVAAKPVLH